MKVFGIPLVIYYEQRCGKWIPGLIENFRKIKKRVPYFKTTCVYGNREGNDADKTKGKQNEEKNIAVIADGSMTPMDHNMRMTAFIEKACRRIEGEMA